MNINVEKAFITIITIIKDRLLQEDESRAASLSVTASEDRTPSNLLVRNSRSPRAVTSTTTMTLLRDWLSKKFWGVPAPTISNTAVTARSLRATSNASSSAGGRATAGAAAGASVN